MVSAVDPPAGILCPPCLRISRRLSSGDCEHCGETIPVAYARRYSDLRPLAVPVFGWSGHGKTVS